MLYANARKGFRFLFRLFIAKESFKGYMFHFFCNQCIYYSTNNLSIDITLKYTAHNENTVVAIKLWNFLSTNVSNKTIKKSTYSSKKTFFMNSVSVGCRDLCTKTSQGKTVPVAQPYKTSFAALMSKEKMKCK